MTLQCVFFVALRGPPWTKGSCSRRCSSPRPSVSSVDKCVAVAVLRGPSRPFVDKRKLQSPLQFSAALRVLRGQTVLPLQFFVFLRGPPWTKGSCSRRCSSPRPSVSSVDKCVAVAVLRVPSRPFVDKRKLQSPLQFSAALRVLRGQMCCRCSSSCSFAALRGQKEVAVAVAVLRGPPCPPWTNVLPLQFFVALRGPSWTKGSRCSSPRPSVSSVDKRKLPLQFSAALRVLRGQMCCRCSSSCSSAALRGQKRCSPRPFVDKTYSHIALHSRTTSITDET